MALHIIYMGARCRRATYAVVDWDNPQAVLHAGTFGSCHDFVHGRDDVLVVTDDETIQDAA